MMGGKRLGLPVGVVRVGVGIYFEKGWIRWAEERISRK
jgi:hypothetical protein